IVEPQLHRLPALSAAGCGVLGALLTRTQLNAARVASYSIGMTAPQTVERLARRFADDVPQGNLDTPAAVGASEHAGVLPQVQGVRADQLGFDPALEQGRACVAGRSPADKTVIRGEFDEYRVAALPGRTRRPGRAERRGQFGSAQM